MTSPMINYQFDEPTVALILEGLSFLPYRRVAGAIAQIEQHARATLSPPPKKKRERKPKAEAPKE
jgi:hypothetical protein